MPLEAIWADGRLDISRARSKSEVASGYVRFRQGDVLCPKVTPTFQAGRSAVVPPIESEVGAATTEVHVLRAYPSRADPRYLRYALLSKPFLDEGISRFQGVAGLQRVPEVYLSDFRVADREISEQRRIADFLDDQVDRIDQVITVRRHQLAQLIERERIAYDDVFTGAGHPLKSLLRMPPRYGVLVPKFVAGGGTPFIRINDLGRLQDYDLALPEIERTQSDEYSRTVVQAGDVLVGVVGSIDKAAVVPRERAGANCARAVARLMPRPGLPSDLLLAWTRTTAYRHMAVDATGSDTAQPTLNMGDLKNFNVALPDVSLDELALRVRDIRSSHQSLAAAMRQSAVLLAERKRSLITAAVTGAFDVSTASTRASDLVTEEQL